MRPKVRAFRDWLFAEMEETQGEVGAERNQGRGRMTRKRRGTSLAGAVSQARLARPGARAGPRGLSVLPAVPARRLRARLRPRDHDHRRRERHREIDAARRHRRRSPATTRPAAARATGRSIIRGAIEAMGGTLVEALRAAWLPKVTTAGSSAPKASSRSRAISTRPRSTIGGRRRTSSRIRTARASCASSRSAAHARASSSSTSRNRRCRPRARSSSCKLLHRMDQSGRSPGDHGDARADPDGLSGRAAAPADANTGSSRSRWRRPTITG